MHPILAQIHLSSVILCEEQIQTEVDIHRKSSNMVHLYACCIRLDVIQLNNILKHIPGGIW